MGKRFVWVVVVLSLICLLSLGAEVPAWQLINWDGPVSAAERLSADKYILPEGWEKAVEGVESIVYFNSGALAHDPATVVNIKKFEELTGIKVNAIEVSSLILFDKTLSVLVSRDPSIHGMSLTDAPLELSQIIGAGWAAFLPFWTPEVQNIYPKALVDAMRGRDGRVYATCDTMRVYVLFYRPSWLKAAGVEKVPETWQEVREAALKCREWAKENLGPDYWGIVFPGDYNMSHMLQAGIYSQGARVLVDGKPVWNSPEGRNSWQLWYDFIVTDKSAPEACLGYTWNDYQEIFAKGKAAMMLGFTTYIVRCSDPELAPGVHTDVFGNPVQGGDFAVVAPPKWNADYPDSCRAAFVDFDAFIVNPFADDRHQAAAMLFAEFRMSKEACRNEVLVEGNDSFFPGLYDDPEVSGKIRFPDAIRLSVQNAVMEAFPPGSKHSIDILTEYFGKAVTGEMDAQAALDAAQKEIDEIYR